MADEIQIVVGLQGPEGPAGSAANLGEIPDVTLTSPSNGQALVFNSTSCEWIVTGKPVC